MAELATDPDVDVSSPRQPAARRAPARAVALSVAALLVFLAVVAALVTRTGGTLVGDTTTNVTATQLLSQMEPGDTVVQPIVASDDLLGAVQVTFGTYLGAADCTVAVSLHEDDGRPSVATGPLIATQEWDCREVPDSAPFEALEIEPIEGSAGTTYDVVVERVDSRDTPGVVLWAGEPRGDAQTAAYDGTPLELSAAVRPMYDPQPTWWAQLDVVVERMAAYGPGWGSAGAFAVLVVTLGVLLAAAPLTARHPRALLVLVAVLALVRGFLWAAAVPAFGGMDEPAHFSNVQYLAVEHDLPGRADNTEVYSEQISVALDRLNLTATAPGDRPDYTERGEVEATRAIEDASQEGGGGGPAGAYSPFYYVPGAVLAAVAGDSFFDQLMAARVASILMGVLAAVLLTIIGDRLFPGRPGARTAFAVAGVVHPMLSHQFAIVNNDGWVVLAGFAALLVALEMARRPHAGRLALLAGAIIGAAVLGKPFGAAVAVPLATGWVIGKVRGRVRSVPVLAREAGLVVAGFALTYGLWRVVARLVGIPLQQVPSGDDGPRSVREFLRAQWDGADLFWGSQLWGNFGWVRIPFPEPIPTALWLLVQATAVGLVVWGAVALVGVARRRRAGRPTLERLAAVDGGAVPLATAGGATSPTVDAPTSDRAVHDAEIPLDARILVVGAMLGAIVATLYAAAWVYYSSSGANDLLQGRYALLALPALLAAPALLVERFTRGRVSPLVVNVAFAIGMAGLTLLGLKRVLEYFYG